MFISRVLVVSFNPIEIFACFEHLLHYIKDNTKLLNAAKSSKKYIIS